MPAVIHDNKGKLIVALLIAGVLGYFTFKAPYRMVGPKPAEAAGAVILLHGYGAPGDDLVRFARILHDRRDDFTYVVLEGPHRGSRGGRSWTPLRVSSDAEYMEGVEESVERIDETIMHLMRAGIAAEDIYLLGYSQGAGMATYYATESADPIEVRGLVAMSGSFLPHTTGRARNTEQLPADFRVLIAHGSQDRVLSIGGARQMESFFTEGRVDTEFVEFDGGHTISLQTRQAVFEFLQAH